jgi:hypothetical protein
LAENKYGQLYTEADVVAILDFVLEDLDSPLTVGDYMEAVRAGEAGTLKFPPDEPTFVLRGQDKRALAAVRFYRDHQNPRASFLHSNGVEKAMTAFEKFRVVHNDRLKEPD